MKFRLWLMKISWNSKCLTYPKYSDILSHRTCSEILISPPYYRLMDLEVAKWVTNSVDPDQMPHSASDLGLQHLGGPYKEENQKVLEVHIEFYWNRCSVLALIRGNPYFQIHFFESIFSHHKSFFTCILLDKLTAEKILIFFLFSSENRAWYFLWAVSSVCMNYIFLAHLSMKCLWWAIVFSQYLLSLVRHQQFALTYPPRLLHAWAIWLQTW